ncbi:MAG: helix-turn-helix domain-containing protein [Actinomycetota bacterium]
MSTVSPTTPERERRAEEIRRAAIPVFASQGFRRTSMADLAQAAGVSRPTVYQYFENRADVFRAAFQAVSEDATDAALAALMTDGTVTERLDGYLQRLKADGYETLAATPFGAELMEARHEFAADVATAAFERARSGLRAFVNSRSSVDADTRATAIDLLILSPRGLGDDAPSPATYRRRLTALASAAALLLEAE